MGRGQPGSRDTSESRGWLSVSSAHVPALSGGRGSAAALLPRHNLGNAAELNAVPLLGISRLRAGSFGGLLCLSAIPEQEAPLPVPSNGSDCILLISCRDTRFQGVWCWDCWAGGWEAGSELPSISRRPGHAYSGGAWGVEEKGTEASATSCSHPGWPVNW